MEMAGLSMERRKMDLFDYAVSCQYGIVLYLGDRRKGSSTAYAMRSPFASEESGVGWPRVVLGDAAQMASVFCLAGLTSVVWHEIAHQT